MASRRSARQLGLELGAEGRPQIKGGGFLRSIDVDRPARAREFPFSIPSIRKLRRLEFHPAVTFFIGENGSGKSTLLEAIAVKSGFSAEGGWKRRAVEDVSASSKLDTHLRLTRGGYPGDGWFLRAESFYNVASEVEALQDEFPSPDPFSAFGGRAPHAQSHGEAFLALLMHRL